MRGSAWMIATGMASRGLGIVGTLILTHLVAPDAYGEVTNATVVAFSLNVLASIGVGVYLIAHPSASPRERFHGVVMHVALGAAFILPMPLFEGPLSRAFEAPTMGQYLPGMVLAVMFERFSLVPERLMVSGMRFRAVSLVRSVAELIYTLVAVVGAALGLGAMAVVAGNVARSGVKLLVLIRLVSWREWLYPHRLSAALFARIARFGVPVTVGQILGFGLRRWDNLVVSHLHGVAVVGPYNLAYNLADIPAVQVGEQITDALQVSYAAADAQDPLRRLLRSIAVLAFIMTPMAVGLGAIAPTLADLFLNERWATVGPMLVWLSIISFPRPLAGAVASYMQVRNRKRAFLALEALTLVALLATLFTIGQVSPIAACIAVGVTFMLRLLASAILLRWLDGVALTTFFRPLVPPLAASLVMATAVTATRLGLARVGAPGALALVVEIGVGVVAYLAAARFVARAGLDDVVTLVRQALVRRRA